MLETRPTPAEIARAEWRAWSTRHDPTPVLAAPTPKPAPVAWWRDPDAFFAPGEHTEGCLVAYATENARLRLRLEDRERMGVAAPLRFPTDAVPDPQGMSRAARDLVLKTRMAQALAACGGVVTKAAVQLGVPKRQMYYHKRRFGL